jgi:tetratricopeptide (TPR) repeat protein
MAYIYRVTVEKIENKQDSYKITWFDKQERTENTFESSAKDLTQDELTRLWHESTYMLSIGEKLFRFLDGDLHLLEQALSEAQKKAEALILQLYTCKETEDWPFEILAKDKVFLLIDKLHLIRYVSDWGKAKKPVPGNHPFKMLFLPGNEKELTQEEIQSAHRAAFDYYKELCDSLKGKTIDPILYEEWVYHALMCGEEETASLEGGLLVNVLRDRLAFLESRRVGEWILSKKKQELSTEHDAFLLNELACTIDDMGDHKEAIKYYERALAIYKIVHGENHQYVATALNNLGAAYKELGDHKEAILYFERALAIDEAVFGKKHPNVAIRLNNLGESWRELGEAKKAITYFERALAIWKTVYGDNHPHVASTLNNLGAAWDDLGEKEKAIEYYEQALAIDEAVFGREHPDVAIDLNNLGLAWKSLGETKKAITYYEQALAILKKVYGEEHPQVATGLNNLGGTYKELGEPKKAITYYERALAIDEKILGKEHPNVARELNNLGAAYFSLEDKKQAKPYFERAYAIRLKFLGPAHPLSKQTAEWLDHC